MLLCDYTVWEIFQVDDGGCLELWFRVWITDGVCVAGNDVIYSR